MSFDNTLPPATAPYFTAGKATLAGWQAGRAAAVGEGCPCHHPCTFPGCWALTLFAKHRYRELQPKSQTPHNCVSTAETPPHPFTSGRGTLDPQVFLVLTPSCRCNSA